MFNPFKLIERSIKLKTMAWQADVVQQHSTLNATYLGKKIEQR